MSSPVRIFIISGQGLDLPNFRTSLKKGGENINSNRLLDILTNNEYCSDYPNIPSEEGNVLTKSVDLRLYCYKYHNDEEVSQDPLHYIAQHLYIVLFETETV